MTTWDRGTQTAERLDTRVLELIWLGPVLLATVATLLTTDRLAPVAALLAVALVPWALQALGRPLPAWLFGAVALLPVAAILTVQGLDASVFLGTTALSVLASRATRAWHLVVLVIVAAVLPFVSALSPQPFDHGAVYFAIGDLLGVALGVVLGYALRLAADLRVADARLHDARAQQERARIARDVHDLVAHSLTVAVLHVGGARRLVATDPAGAVVALEQAEEVCRDSLDGIRQVVGLLRGRDDLPSGAGDIPDVVETYRAAGVLIDSRFDLPLPGLPLILRGLLRRVVQEALANAARYRTPGSSVGVDARIVDDEVVLTVGNASPERRQTSSGGFGLVGLREQVEAVGGTLTSGYGDGRWEVVCVLPLTPSAVVTR